MKVEQIDVAAALGYLDKPLHDDLRAVLGAGYEVYVVLPRRIHPDGTNTTGWFYVTESAADNAPLATVETPDFPRLGQYTEVSANLTPSREHGSGMLIRSNHQGEGEHLSVLEALKLALVPYPRNSFQPNIGVKNAGAQTIFKWFKGAVRVVDQPAQ